MEIFFDILIIVTRRLTVNVFSQTLRWQPLLKTKFKMASSNEKAIARLINSGRMPQNNDEGLLSFIEDYIFEGNDELPRGKVFHTRRQEIAMNLLIMTIN